MNNRMTDLVEGIQDDILPDSLRDTFDQVNRPEELLYVFQSAVQACRDAAEGMANIRGDDDDFQKFVFGYQVGMILDAFNKRVKEISQ